ncbi:MAG: copper chaperone PCu(A)C [Pseudomonadota bacterium]
MRVGKKKLGVLMVLLLTVACGQKQSETHASHAAMKQGADHAKFVVSDAWVRLVPGDKTAAYFTFKNNTAVEVNLTGVHMDGVKNVQIHETIAEDDMMSMRQIESVAVPANTEVYFEAGGKHVMLMGVSKRLREGEQMSGTVTLDGHESVLFDATVRSSQPRHLGHQH